MPEEYEYLDETIEPGADEQRLYEAQMQKQRNVANNANNIRAAADIASKTANPYAKAIGGAVKAADKLTGGRTSQQLGKRLNTLNKFNPSGRLLQKASNKIAESGTADRIGKAVNKKNQTRNQTLAGLKSNAVAEGKNNESSLDRREVEDQTSDGGEVNLKATAKFLKIAFPAMVGVVFVVIFIGIFMIPSMAVESIFGIGGADEASNSEMDDKLDKVKEDDIDEKKSKSAQTFDYDLFIDDQATKFRNSKLKKISKIREYNEVDISELEDYYPNISSYIDDEGNNMNTVYTFFFKLRYIYLYYSDTYNVELDMPLLMSTLTVQEKDMDIVFNQNIKGYGYLQVMAKQNYFDSVYKLFIYNYKPTENNSKYDIEILAQNMVKNVPYVAEEKTCENPVNNDCYLIDNDKYDEFLKAFLAEKYSIDDEAQVMGLIAQIYDVKEQYEDLVGDYEEQEPTIYGASSTSYWWPIGSKETTVVDGKIFATGDPETTLITSYFGYRIDPISGQPKSKHSGIDIAGVSGAGNINIIAARDGIVVYPYAGSRTDCPYTTDTNNLSQRNCGGKYGNYVIIQHSDGNYTLYAHLHANTITVLAGDSVRQGQVIAKMGSSGYSTGPHLHFEVREGVNEYNATVDPLGYISAETPRASLFSLNPVLVEFIHSWEGKPPQEGDYYIAFDDGYGNLTIGWGVVPKYHPEKFAALGVDVSNIKIGDKISKEIVDQVENQELQEDYDKINNMLSNASITLKQYQVDALVSRCYNYNVSGFVAAYKQFGDTQELYDNFMSKPITSNGEVAPGLVRRRNAEWAMFHNGEYQNNS